MTPCLEKVRVDKQAALEGVRKQELALDDALRQQHAHAQEQRVAEKTKAAQTRGDRPDPSPSALKPPQVDAPRAVKASAAKTSAPDRRATEKREREAFEARQRETQAHREAVARRNAERAGRKTAKPLLLPASAAARP